MGRTISKVQQALSWSSGEAAVVKLVKPPLGDAEFHTYLNHQGQLSRPEQLRLRIYHGGVEPALRKVVWRYLLNVYPDGLTGQERMDYIKRKTREYEQLKGEWARRAGPEDLEFVSSMVLKDVLRTDRAHPYYAGSEDSAHLRALRDLLVTYAVTHPQISYCQGMSDIASPILAVMDHEGQAYVCFCGIMKRLQANFQSDGQAMAVKFRHLRLLLRHTDPEFYGYLASRGADDLLFCYRWLLLELKREFCFDDALRLLEVSWSSLPPDPPEAEVELTAGDPGTPAASPRGMVRPVCPLVQERGDPEPPPGLRLERQEEEGESLQGPGVKKSASAPLLKPPAGADAAGGGGGEGPTPGPPLPPPQEFGHGNPFVLFLCLALLLEHRELILNSQLDYNELAMHFDRLVRRQNLQRVLHRAKALFADYLQSEVWDSGGAEAPVGAVPDPAAAS